MICMQPSYYDKILVPDKRRVCLGFDGTRNSLVSLQVDGMLLYQVKLRRPEGASLAIGRRRRSHLCHWASHVQAALPHGDSTAIDYSPNILWLEQQAHDLPLQLHTVSKPCRLPPALADVTHHILLLHDTYTNPCVWICHLERSVSLVTWNHGRSWCNFLVSWVW
jgi:hypothetical protein